MITIPFLVTSPPMGGGESDSGRIWIVPSGRGPSYLSFENKETAERIAGIVARDAKRNRNSIFLSCPAAIADETLPLFGG